MYESEQWTYTDRGHTPLTVDTQEYTCMGQHSEGINCVLLKVVCVRKRTVDIYRLWTHTTDSGHTGMGQQREGID